MARIPISKGEKIIATNIFCTNVSCRNEYDMPLRKSKCSKCKAIIPYYDKQDYEENLQKHLRSAYYSNMHLSIQRGSSNGTGL